MGYLFLALSLLCGATKGFCGKKTSGFVREYKDAMFANFIRMLFCIAIGFALLLFGGGLSALRVSPMVAWICLLSGFANASFVVLWLISVKNGAYMMLDVFCMVGVLIPIIGSALLFNETIEPHHIIGFAILLCAVFIMCSYNNSVKTKMTPLSLLLLIGCGITNGLLDFSQKLFRENSGDTPIAVFNLYTYFVSAVLLGICFLAFSAKSKSRMPSDIKPIFGYILVMSLCLFLYSYFKTLAAGYLSSAQLYPLAQSGSLILSCIMAAVFFKEKLTAKCVLGILLSFAALIVINVL